MARTNARVVLNRRNADELRLAVADGLLEIGEAVVREARPPDAEPYGVGLVTAGGAVAYIDGRKVGGQASKPSRERVPRPGIVAFAGFGFPARFQEIGTVRHAAQPFLWPAFSGVQGRIASIMAPAVRMRLARRGNR